MKHIRWQIVLGLALILLSALLYYCHYLLFRDAHHIFIYMVGDIAFVPIEVLLVTLIIHKVLSIREKKNRLEKLNMVIGAFFSELGTTLLARLSDADPQLEDIKKDLVITTKCSDREFAGFRKKLKTYAYDINSGKIDLESLRALLLGKREFLLRLLENPTLLEHESFTDLLRAVFHAVEELGSRGDIKQLPGKDIEHLAGDVKRAYSRLVFEWVDYMKHLKDNYPYLFSLAMRMNPFDQDPSPVVR
ncbi:MAG TPA: hypothetical protein ENG95_00470 [Nitrospirae bacterium]|nr:hypothetical protein BMS3Abin10_01719 [bacterium BMS3Abin10]GBE39134.1 hypothetical protein BMS3Bbin08_01754 [bacterium BMS3Bbin08]HDH50202.1 hypothetical protein [Nitrospirota bacterium]HDK81377.1 hypothetical protein [Nitrospirota bacterium]HDO25100.1 hypothetical protein [Nitrospirota bacterium]